MHHYYYIYFLLTIILIRQVDLQIQDKSNWLFRFKTNSLADYLTRYLKDSDILRCADGICLLIDEGAGSTKGLITFSSYEKMMQVNNCFLAFLSTAKESRASAEIFLRSFQSELIIGIAQKLELNIHMSGDLKSIAAYVGLSGPTSNHPCILCDTKRERKRRGKRDWLMNPEVFYAKGLPRDVKDWDDVRNFPRKGLIAMNPAFREIMHQLGETRIDAAVLFAPLHTMLTLNRIFENAIEPSSWITNWEEKLATKTLTQEEISIVRSTKRLSQIMQCLVPIRNRCGRSQWLGKDINRLCQIAPEIQQRLKALNMRDALVFEFLDVLEAFHLLRTRCFKRRLHLRWKGAIYNFREVVIPFLSKHANAGNTYVHLVCCHLEEILLKNQPHGLASIAHDQAIEHSHSICR